MTGVGLAGHTGIVDFAVRTSRGGVSESGCADVVVLVVLVGAGMRTPAALRGADPGGRGGQDEFAVRVWQLVEDLLAMMLVQVKR